MIGVAVTSAIGAYMMKPILNNIFISKDEKMLYIMPFLIIAVFISRGIFRFLATYLADVIGIAITKEIRAKMFDRAVNADFTKVSEKTVGDINAHIIQTVLNLRNIIVKTIPKFLISLFTIIALIILVIYLNWKLSLLAIMFASIIVFPVKYLGSKVKNHVLQAEKMISGLTNRINEVFNNFDIVKIYNNADYEKKEFENILDKYQSFQLKLSKYQEATSPIMELFVSLAIASVVFFGGLAVVEKDMSVGDFFSFLTALLMLYGPIKIITKNTIILNILDNYIKRIENILNLPQEKSDLKKLNDQIKKIEFIDVSLQIGKNKILEGVDFTINRGETIALVGKTGVGKSSILTLLFGFRKPSSGRILINSIDINKLDKNSLRKEISYVNQGASIFNMTIKENIIYGFKYNEERYKNAIKLAHCEFIKDLPKKDNFIVGENGKKLSGGQKQRIALARAIYKDGSLFVLDEATSALDASTENLIQKSLKKIMQYKTTIVIAHRLNTIKNADRVIVLNNGKIAEIGTYKEVSNSDAFKKNFALSQKR
jgi:subfamily B ATP-binding cassette protein MsbA